MWRCTRARDGRHKIENIGKLRVERAEGRGGCREADVRGAQGVYAGQTTNWYLAARN